MAVTITDVARRAGVSKAAVSYVLNGRETSIKITEATRKRIHAAACDLDYHPNALARGLAHKRTHTIAVVMQYARMFSGWSGFTNEMMRGASEAAFQHGYDLLLHTTDQPSVEQEVAALMDGRADGALLLRDVDDPLADKLSRRKFPFVLMFSRSDNPELWQVDCDNVLGGRLATEHLIGLGHRRILHLTGVARSASARDRRLGYEQALREAGIDARAEWCVELTFAGASFDPVEALLRGPERPTAVFAWSDEVAMRLMTLARGLGLRIPEDLSVIGFDSTELCDHTDPPLTSMRQPICEMAEHALSLLIRRIRRAEVEDRREVFEPVMVERGSCALPSRTAG